MPGKKMMEHARNPQHPSEGLKSRATGTGFTSENHDPVRAEQPAKGMKRTTATRVSKVATKAKAARPAAKKKATTKRRPTRGMAHKAATPRNAAPKKTAPRSPSTRAAS